MAGFLREALVTSPVETSAWLQMCCANSCDVVATDVASAIAAVRLAREFSATQCRASARAQAKLATAAVEGLRNVVAGLDAVTSLCASAMASADNAKATNAGLEEARRACQLVLDLQSATDGLHHPWSVAGLDVDLHGQVGAASTLERVELADAGVLLELHFKRWLDVLPSNDDCRFTCVVDKGNVHACWPRGRHSFTLHANATVWSTFDGLESAAHSEFMAPFTLLAQHVQVSVDGDPTATCTLAQHSDECGVIATYTADPKPDQVEITVHVLGSAVCKRRLVIVVECAFACIGVGALS